MALVRHIGSTPIGTRCAVVFRELPDDPLNCLVYEADSMHEFFRDEISKVTMQEGQKSRDLYEVLHRNFLANGENMLNALHRYGYLRKYATNEITMHTGDGTKIRLDLLNEQMRGITRNDNKQQSADVQDKFNPFDDAQDAEAGSVAEQLAKEAFRLEKEAASKRKRALALDSNVKCPRMESSMELSEMTMEQRLDLFVQLQEELGVTMPVPEAAPAEIPEGFALVDMRKSQRQMLEDAKDIWRTKHAE